MNYLIIEDEPLAQEELVSMLQKISDDYTLVGKVTTVERAIQWFSNNPMPDLIFMDIHLADSICFDIFKEVEITAPIIFTTAYDQYAIQAFQTTGIGYLLKPYSQGELETAVEKYHSMSQSGNTNAGNINQLIRQLTQQQTAAPRYKERILAKIGDNYQHLQISDIAYFYSEDHYTYATTNDNKQLIVNPTLATLEGTLDPNAFFQISRNFIVNIKAIEIVNRHLNGRLKIAVKPTYKDDIFVARNRVNTFLEWLDGNISNPNS